MELYVINIIIIRREIWIAETFRYELLIDINKLMIFMAEAFVIQLAIKMYMKVLLILFSLYLRGLFLFSLPCHILIFKACD